MVLVLALLQTDPAGAESRVYGAEVVTFCYQALQGRDPELPPELGGERLEQLGDLGL